MDWSTTGWFHTDSHHDLIKNRGSGLWLQLPKAQQTTGCLRFDHYASSWESVLGTGKFVTLTNSETLIYISTLDGYSFNYSYLLKQKKRSFKQRLSLPKKTHLSQKCRTPDTTLRTEQQGSSYFQSSKRCRSYPPTHHRNESTHCRLHWPSCATCTWRFAKAWFFGSILKFPCRRRKKRTKSFI